MVAAMVPRSLISPLTITLAALGLACMAIGVVYFAVTSAHLPSFIPGHVAVPTHALKNGRIIRTHADTKRGMAALAVAAVVFAAAWFLRFRYEPVD